ncbi:MAG: hypothetical protein BGO01_10275 [Armatimonadetes bacterium 55-13]|nr:hypothetical protein [Armatimonadota bacterium]OJU62784.1 MAG: hypothetical protein BGO01_10275 [Armatimonadetes bacterium 55-13]
MRIFDFEAQRDLSDVSISLSREEAVDLLATLERLIKQPNLSKVYLSQIQGNVIERELAIALDRETPALAQIA